MEFRRSRASAAARSKTSQHSRRDSANFIRSPVDGHSLPRSGDQGVCLTEDGQKGNPTLTSSTRNGNRANIVNDAVTGQPIALATPSDALGQYAYDGSGNPFGLLTNSTAAFGTNVDPYGTETVTYDGGGDGLVSNPFAFKTGIDDTATGMVKFGQRWYDPYIGAWTQQDTLDNPLDPANGNRYAYAASDPINGSDPSGNSSVPGCTFAVIGAIGGLAGATLLAPETLGASIAAGVVVVAGAFTASGAITINCFQ
jgi:RHS repeat-associated protein